VLGFRVFDFLVQLGGLVMIYHLAKKLFGMSVAGSLASLSYSVYYFGLNFDTGQRDCYSFLCLLAAAIITLSGKWGNWAPKILVGLLIGFAFLIKPTFGLSWPFFGFWFLAEGFRKRPKLIWAELAAFSLACFLPTLSIVSLYWRAGQIEQLYYSTIWYEFEIFAKISSASHIFSVIKPVFLSYTLLNMNPFVLAGAAFAVLTVVDQWRESKQKKLLVMLIFMLVICFASIFIQGKNNFYHRAPFWGFAMILGGAGWALIGSRIAGKGAGIWPRLCAWSLYLFLALLTVTSLDWRMLKFAGAYTYRGLNKSYNSDFHIWTLDDQRKAADYIKTLKKPGDQMEYVGWHPFLPYLAETKVPSRFCCTYHLLLRHYDGRIRPMQQQWMDEYVRDTISARPRFFVISTHIPVGETMLLKDFSLKNHLKNDFPALQEFFEKNYRLINTVGSLEIYELNGSSGQNP